MRLNLKIKFLVIFFLLHIILFLNSINALDFNQSDIKTWTPQNWDKVTKLDPNLRDSIWLGANPEDRNNVVKGLVLKNNLNSQSGLLGYAGTLISPIKVIGFGDKSLKWIDENKISDGKVIFDVKNIPKDVLEIEYKSAKPAVKQGDTALSSKLIYRFKDNKEIELLSGSVSGNNLIINQYDENGRIIKSFKLNYELKDKNSRIFVGRDGVISLSGDAILRLGDKEFSVKDRIIKGELSYDKKSESGTLEIISENYFRVSDLKIKTENLAIRTSGSFKTDIIFDSGSYDYNNVKNPFVQIDKNKIKMYTASGAPGMEVEVLKEYKDADGNLIRYDVSVYGDYMTFINGKLKYYIDKEKITDSRIVPSDNKNNPIKTYPFQLSSLYNPDIKIYNDGDFTGTKIRDSVAEERVCIGSFCRVGFKTRGLVGDEVSENRPFGSEVGSLERLVAETKIYARGNEVQDFVDLAKKEAWDETRIREEASKRFTQTETRIVVKKADGLIWSTQVKPLLDEGFKSMKLSSEEQKRVDEFQMQVYRSLTNDNVPASTVMTTVTRSSTGEKDSYVEIIVTLPGQRTMTHRIPGAYFEKVRTELFNNPYSLSEIIGKIRK